MNNPLNYFKKSKSTPVEPRGVDRVTRVLADFEQKKAELETAIDEIDADIASDKALITRLRAGIAEKELVHEKAENAVKFLSNVTG